MLKPLVLVTLAALLGDIVSHYLSHTAVLTILSLCTVGVLVYYKGVGEVIAWLKGESETKEISTNT